MELRDIIKEYTASSNMRRLSGILEKPERSRIFLEGMSGSLPALFAAAWCTVHDQRALFILPDREEAAFFLNDLENLLGINNALFFPSSLKKAYNFPVIDNGNVLLRAEVLTHLGKNVKPLPVVTYAEAFHEKVVTRKALAGNTVEARVGESLSVDFLMDFLNENDFIRSDFVYEAGQYSIRGGIVDIFSFANEFPYRVEFDGDRIGSIRSFDPSTQLSEKMMHHITIIPNLQGKLMRDDRQPFAEFLPDDTVIWCRDLPFSFELIQSGMKKMDELFNQQSTDSSDQESMTGSPLEAFDTIDTITGLLQKFRIVEFGSKPEFIPGEVIQFKSKPQPSFNKNFTMLGETLLSHEKSGIRNIIFADTAKQIERLYAIFQDIHFPGRQPGQEIPFSPILLSLHEGFIDAETKLACFTDHQVFDRYHRYRVRKHYNRSEALTLKEIYSLKPGDFVTHIDHGIGKFAGLEKLDVNGKMQEAIRLVYKDNDILYVSIHSLHRIARYTGKEGAQPKLNKLGSSSWTTLKQKTKKKVKDIARDLISLYAQRRAQKGFAFQHDTYLQNELEASFIYEDTPDQVKSTADVKKDMEKQYPMDRLICGDVGFGKTEIAIRAAFKAVTDGKQVAILVPTTILALQHYKTFRERLKEFPCTVDYLNRFKTAAQQTETLKRLIDGKIDILIGTHRLLSKDIKFKDLGLLIVDEEQKFGVAAKEKLKALRVNVDTLTLTATPIPRTLQFSLMGARDLSIINTPPPNRYPVTTEVHTFDEKLIREAVNYEVSRGGQVFFIHNRVQDIHEIAGMIKKLCPDVKIGVGHGQMDGPPLEKVLVDFIEGETDVLVSTTIVESGIDISNANTMIINQAHHFGLSDLHQMRGRVGRSNKKAFCYLLAPPLSVLTPEARQRLKAIEEFSDLGSGFNVAMRDLDIRGAGNLLGGEQSGFISEIGYEMYHKILDEAIQELRETDFKDLFPVEEQTQFTGDCQIDTDLEILIPSEYISNVSERLTIYKEIDDLTREEQINSYMDNLKDRFGPLPVPVQELFSALRLRWKAKQLGFEKLVMRGGLLKGYFISNPESPFYKSQLFGELINYIQSNPKRIKLTQKQDKLSISFMGVRSVQMANQLFDDMRIHLTVKAEA